jgi:hypothetical protein
METKFNFKSQICTSREQSERLLALGLKKETADMCYRYVNTVKGEKKYELIVEAAWSQEVIDEYVRFGTKIGLFDNLVHPCGKPVTPLEARADVTKNDIPAWSLHRLIEIVPSTINKMLWFTINPYTAFYDSVDYIKSFDSKDNLYDNIIDCIEWLIKEGYFNKEYLEE